MKGVLVNTLLLIAKHYPTYHRRDGWHNSSLIPGLECGSLVNLDNDIVHEKGEQVVDPEVQLSNQERTAVLHLAEAWTPQGHPAFILIGKLILIEIRTSWSLQRIRLHLMMKRLFTWSDTTWAPNL